MAWAGKNTHRQLELLDGVAEKYAAMAVVNGIEKDEAQGIKYCFWKHMRICGAGITGWRSGPSTCPSAPKH
jgi:hypothetical protein